MLSAADSGERFSSLFGKRQHGTQKTHKTYQFTQGSFENPRPTLIAVEADTGEGGGKFAYTTHTQRGTRIPYRGGGLLST